jgi:hypothetical protein
VGWRRASTNSWRAHVLWSWGELGGTWSGRCGSGSGERILAAIGHGDDVIWEIFFPLLDAVLGDRNRATGQHTFPARRPPPCVPCLSRRPDARKQRTLLVPTSPLSPQPGARKHKILRRASFQPDHLDSARFGRQGSAAPIRIASAAENPSGFWAECWNRLGRSCRGGPAAANPSRSRAAL